MSSSNLWKVVAVSGLAAFTFACGGGTPPGDDAGTCSGALVRCGTQCLDVSADTANCGGCGVVCPAPTGGTAACVAGHCSGTCASGSQICGARVDATGQVTLECTDVGSDSANCGACGTRCGFLQSCTAGQCTDCAAGSLRCPSGAGAAVCTPVMGDPANCGGCGVTCAAAEGGSATCVQGRCSAACDAGMQLCGARLDAGVVTLVCSDGSRDPVNCGGCGQTCLPQQTCSAGACSNCPVGQLQCPVSGSPGVTACRSVLTDGQNCGGCGNSCSGGSRCDNGVCVATTLTNCAGVATDLQNDRLNCGACNRACATNEQCRGGVCRPCSGIVCSNVCVDPGADARHCGGCGQTCTGTAACVGGSCAAPLSLTILWPADGGLVPTGTFAQSVRVDSALPMARVMMNLSLGGADAGAFAMSFSPSLEPAGVPRSLWSANVSMDAGTIVTVTAWDIAWRPDAGDAALHTATAQAGPVTVLAPPTTTPTLQATLTTGVTIPQNGWLGLNAPSVNLRAASVGAATAVQFINRGVSDSYVLGTASVDGGAAVLQVSAAELATPAGVSRIVACPVDAAGQVTAISDCTTGASSNQLTLTVGRVPSANAVLTADTDGGAPTLWYLQGTSLYAVGSDSLVPALPTSAIGATTFISGSLELASDSSSSVLAVRPGALDRFDCPTGGNCNHQPWVGNGSFTLARLHAQTARSVLLGTAGGAYVYANNPGGVSPPSAQQLGASPSYPITSGNLATQSSRGAMSSGAIVVYTQAGLGAGPYQLRIIHPNVSGGSTTLGPQHSGLPLALQVFASGEVLWIYVDNSGNAYAQAAFFDGTTLRVGAPSAMVGSASPGLGGPPELARAKLAVGAWTDSTGVPMILVADYAPTQPTVTFPTPPSTTVGPLVSAVGTRRGRGPWAVSDDLAKAIYVTADPNPGDPLEPTTYTLRMLDLTTKTAGPVFSSPRLQGATGLYLNDFLPHFVHSPSSWSNTPPGGTPPTTLAAVPAVVFAEALAPEAGLDAAYQEARLFFALYGSAATTPAPVLVDRLGLLPGAPFSSAVGRTVIDSSAGASILFLTSRAGWFDLYSVPIAAPASSTASSSLVMDSVAAFRVRDDKGRLLAVRSDGSLYGARLVAGVPPSSSLAVLGEGGWTGSIGMNDLRQATETFNFTADGDHAWMMVGLDQSQLIGFSTTSTLRALDLVAGSHQNLGPAAWMSGLSLTPLPCFTNGAQTVLGYALPPVRYTGATARFFVETTGSLARVDPGVGAFVVNAGSVPSCRVSLDGTEARAWGPGTGWFSVSGQGSTQSIRAFSGAPATSLVWPAVSGPTAPEVLPEFEMFTVPHSGSSRQLFKVWGRGPGGAAMPYVPVGVGAVSARQTLWTATNSTLLLVYQSNTDPATAFGVTVPLSGRAPLLPLLP